MKDFNKQNKDLNIHDYATEQEIELLEEALAPYGKNQGEYTIEDYYALSDNIRAELIDGSIYYLSAPNKFHQFIVGEIYFQIMDFIKKNKGKCMTYVAPRDVRLNVDNRNILQPDVLIVCDKDKDKDDYIEGAPDFILEVLSKTTAFKDKNIKVRKYMEAGVREYWILDPDKRILLIYELDNPYNPIICGLEEPVPIEIYNGELNIDFTEINLMLDAQ